MSFAHLNATIPTHDGKNMGAYLAKAANPHAPVMIVIQEIFGVNAGLRAMCDEWAQNGFHAICPDLFWRIEAGLQLSDAVDAEMQKAFQLFGDFDVQAGVQDLQSTLDFARSFAPSPNRVNVGTVGYCLGGKLAYLMATQSDADCNISYYGVGLDALLGDAGKINHPFLMHIAGEDQFVPRAAQDKILHAVTANSSIEAHRYEGADHAFARINGVHYNQDAATLANSRTLDFAKKHLG